MAGGCQLDLPVKFATARSFIHHDQRPALERAFAFGLTAPASGTGGPVPAPNRFLLLIGHTDQVGSVASNQSLSLQRANAVLAVFTVDATIWEANFQAEHWNGPNFEIATMSAWWTPQATATWCRSISGTPRRRPAASTGSKKFRPGPTR